MSTVAMDIPLEQIEPSPLQYRKTLSEAGLAALAEDVKAHGVLQRVRVRPNPDGTLHAYQLVYGHRRFIAAARAGLQAIPADVAAMSDEEVRLAQIAENMGREDVHPIEEGEAFQVLISEHGYTRERIAHEYGRSVSLVTGRLKLLQAHPDVRKACLDGHIDAEAALLFARLRTPKLQEKALAAVKGKGWDLEDGGKRSYRQIRELLVEKFTLELKGAMFDTADALLLPDAGACTTCPKRSGNAPEFEDLQAPREGGWRGKIKPQPDLCTDPDCWEAKTKAHLANRAAALEAKGKTVIGGAKARALIGADGQVKGDYVPLADVRDALKAAKGSAKPEVVTLLNPRNDKTVDVVKVEDLKAAGVKVAGKGRASGRNDAEAERKRREERWQREQDEVAAETARRRALFLTLHDAIRKAARSDFDLRLLASYMLDAVDDHEAFLFLSEVWKVPAGKTFEDLVPSMSAADLTVLLIECALVSATECDCIDNIKDVPQALLEALEHYGVVDPAQTSAKPAAAKKAARAKKPSPQGDMLEAAGA